MKQSELVNRTIFFFFLSFRKKNLAPHNRRAHVQMFTSMTKNGFWFFFWHFLSNNTALFKQIIKTNIYLNVQAS